MSSSFQAEFLPDAEGHPRILSLAGRISFREAPHLRATLFGAISPAGHHLFIDLAKVEAMDTAALAVLVEGMVATEDEEQEIFLCAPSDSVRRIFHLAGLESALAKCWDCVDSASRAIAE